MIYLIENGLGPRNRQLGGCLLRFMEQCMSFGKCTARAALCTPSGYWVDAGRPPPERVESPVDIGRGIYLGVAYMASRE